MEPRIHTTPDLHEDVLRVIFEIAAEENGPERISYALVSKAVQTWVEPIFYREVVASGRGIYLFFRTIDSKTSTKPPNFFALHVKSLDFTGLSSRDNELVNVSRIFEECPGVQSLSFRERDVYRTYNLHPILGVFLRICRAFVGFAEGLVLGWLG
ncbi:hypothetical protein DFP72DRAFT_532369 [Ephemerocybe angulata]|uniref:Uncharacterized protein n=1 Tax=Ephemerocybe angulata TaxID=980116 RepID=A0A8H6M1J2_9AGAR|nr:hypothetical protein DFP72DRAFT_532369 [Tulosesus angulatus]